MNKRQDLIDYAMILFCIAIVVIVIVALLGEELGNVIMDFFSRIPGPGF